MTKLDIYAAWIVFALQTLVAFFAVLQATGLQYFTNDTAMIIIAGVSSFSLFFETWVKKAQDLYDKIKLLRKA